MNETLKLAGAGLFGDGILDRLLTLPLFILGTGRSVHYGTRRGSRRVATAPDPMTIFSLVTCYTNTEVVKSDMAEKVSFTK